MDDPIAPFEILKQILRHIRNPGLLDDHPWARALIVQEALARDPELCHTSPGQQLISALAALFRELQPATPPRCGKRHDPRWGEFGLLAALYFTPFNHGTSFPTSLMDGWRQIDPAILYFVYGKCAGALTEEQIKKAELIGADIEYGAPSTLSDWHKKGLQRFTEIILNRERFLARTTSQPSTILERERPGVAETAKGSSRHQSSRWRKVLCWSASLLLVTALGLGALKSWRIYNRALPVYQDMIRLQETVRGPLEVKTVSSVMPLLRRLQEELLALKIEARPLLWLTPRLNWIPIYGNDLASVSALIDVVEHLLSASILASQAGEPLFSQLASSDPHLNPEGLTGLIVQAQPQLKDARAELDQALTSRKTIVAERLSPRLQRLVMGKLDPILKFTDEGLALAIASPRILGAGEEGPKTYLLLAENEDELRPTGGFITSVGNLVLHNGTVISLEFESVDDNEQEDWSKPYPAAPWQLQQYMDSPVLILRDANWFTDFPTTVQWVEYLFAYTHSHSVDGIMAFDQHFLVMLLGPLGPLEVEGAPYPITAENVIQYMRESKIRPVGESSATGWYRKEFINKLAAALFKELSTGQSHDWQGIARVLVQAMTEHHLLVQFDDPVATALMAERGWDNAVRPDGGDFLIVTDTNIGFNKTNAVVDVSLTYDVDLRNPSLPIANLAIVHKNNSSSNVPCLQGSTRQITGEVSYTINSCYWSYLRVYKQEGVELLDATPHFVPGSWMLNGENVPPRVDELDEKLEGVEGFGTLLVVPGGKALATRFTFSLPGILQSVQDDPSQLRYRLKIQKQPGTLAIPVTIRVHLPNRARLIGTSIEGTVQGNDLQIDTNLRTDLKLDIEFSLPYGLPQE